MEKGGTISGKTDRGRHNSVLLEKNIPGLCISFKLYEHPFVSLKNKVIFEKRIIDEPGIPTIYQQVIHKMWKTYVNKKSVDIV